MSTPVRDELSALATADPSKMTDEELRDYISRLAPKKKADLARRVDQRMQEERRVWFCGDRTCDGLPHGVYAYPHARGSKREDQRGSQYPPLGTDWYTWLLGAGRGAGKLLALDTPVPTPTGWTTMGDLQDGDEVFDEQGRVCRVVKAHPVRFPERAFRLTFSDHSQIVAGGEHQWVTWTHRDRKALNRSGQGFPADWVNWRSTKSIDYSAHPKPAGLARALELMEQGWSQRRAAAEAGVSRNAIRNSVNQSYARLTVETGVSPTIRTTDEIVATFRQGERGDLNHSIPTAHPLDLPERDLPLDPYVLGAWLGDGDTNGGGFTQHVDDADLLMTALAPWSPVARPDKRKPTTLRIGTRGLSALLKEIGVRGRKHIPVDYLRASVRQRLDLLAGLMDTDGHIDHKGLCEYTTVLPGLADGVMELLRTLGQKPVLKESDATLRGRITGKRFRITWRPTFNPSRLPRKAERFRPLGNQGSRSQQRMIVGYEEIDPIPMRCITVDSPNSMYLAGEAMIPTHNTRTGSEYTRYISKKIPLLALIGPTGPAVRNVMIEGPSGLIAACEAAGEYVPGMYEPSKQRFTFANGARATLFTAEEPARIRGGNFGFFWGDEPAHWDDPEEAWSQAQFANRVGRRPHALATTTPLPNDFIKNLMKAEDTVYVGGSTYDNMANLAEAVVRKILAKYEGTFLGRQEIHGEIIDDREGALWRSEQFTDEDFYFEWEDVKGSLDKVYVGIDPAGSNNKRSDLTGIIVGGKRGDVLYAIDDFSGKYSPSGWAQKAMYAYELYKADAIVVERNFGGDMCRATLKAEGFQGRIVEAQATDGKRVRAEPIAAKYEQKKARHRRGGRLAKLESEQVSWIPGEGKSPNRLDAWVWASSKMMKGSGRATMADLTKMGSLGARDYQGPGSSYAKRQARRGRY